MRSNTALPKFGTVKRAGSVAPGANVETAPLQTTMFDQKKTVSVKTKPTVEIAEANSTPMKTKSNSSKPKFVAKILSVLADSVRTLKTTFTEIFSNGRSRRKTTPPTAQPELALEKIAVLRNDLSDADLEVVEQKQALLLGINERAGEGWKRRTVRFVNPKTGYEVEKEIGMQKNPHVVEVSSLSDVVEFLEREKAREHQPELVEQV